MILTRLFLQTKSTNWINYLDEIIKNYNNNGHSAIDYIAPNEVFFEPYGSISIKSPSTLKKNFEKIYNINYEKSLFNISINLILFINFYYNIFLICNSRFRYYQ